MNQSGVFSGNQDAEKSAKGIVKNVVQLSETETVTDLGIFDAAAEAAETACNQKDLPSGRIPTAEEQGSTHAQREKQQDIHQIAAQQFRVAALKHLKVGVKGDEDRGLKLSGRAGQNGLIHNNKDSAEQYDRKPRVPPPSTAKAVMQNQQQDCD